MKAIDVSHWNGLIDWYKVKNAGVEAVFIKATEGNNVVDSSLYTNAKGAHSVGLKLGFYSYGHPDIDPAESARFFWETVKEFENYTELPYILDLETTDGQTGTAVDDWASRFLMLFENYSHKDAGIYSGEWFATAYLTETLKKFPFHWIAKYSSEKPSVKWMVWQDSQSGTVAGINGVVDIDEMQSSIIASAIQFTKFYVMVDLEVYSAIYSHHNVMIDALALHEYSTPFVFNESENTFVVNDKKLVRAIEYEGKLYIPWDTICVSRMNAIPVSKKIEWIFTKVI